MFSLLHLMLPGGFKRDTAIAAVSSGEADAVVFGRYFISNPDLVRRIATDAPLNKYDRCGQPPRLWHTLVSGFTSLVVVQRRKPCRDRLACSPYEHEAGCDPHLTMQALSLIIVQALVYQASSFRHVHAKHIMCTAAFRGAAALDLAECAGDTRMVILVAALQAVMVVRVPQLKCLAALQVHLLCFTAWPDGGLHRLPLPGGVSCAACCKFAVLQELISQARIMG
jgi:hypothetical protein